MGSIIGHRIDDNRAGVMRLTSGTYTAKTYSSNLPLPVLASVQLLL